MIFAAIDPGAVNAAIAVFENSTPIHVGDLRTAGGMVLAPALAQTLIDLQASHVVVENVHSMPRQGVASTFKFGMGCGIIRGVIGTLRLPLTLVAPTQWKRFHKLGADKEQARQLAIQRWPNFEPAMTRKKDSNRAEALLIGDWFYVDCIIPRTLKDPRDGFVTDVPLPARRRLAHGEG